MTALTTTDELIRLPHSFWPDDAQWHIFAKVWAERPIPAWLLNSTIAAVGSVALSMFTSVLAGYSLSRFSVRGGHSLGMFILTAKMLPATLLVIPLFAMFRSVGMIGSLWTLAIAHSTLIVPFTTWMLKGLFDTMPRELEQAAMVDGCSPLGAMLRVILPVSAPGLAATALYAFVLSWSEYAYARTFTRKLPRQLDCQSGHHNHAGRIHDRVERKFGRGCIRGHTANADLSVPGTIPGRRSCRRLGKTGKWRLFPSRIFRRHMGGLAVLREFSVEMADGEFVVLVGPSGCGKSTIPKILTGLEPTTGGRVLIGDHDVTDMAPGDRDVAMVFQNYALYPHLSVRKNIGFGLRMRQMRASEIERRATEAARILAIESYLDRRPCDLSGGQRQRVALGRAIVREPKAFLMDEPLSNLDTKLRVHMRAEIGALHKRLGVAAIFVTHDQIEAMAMADRVVIIREGEIQQIATPDEVFMEPANLFVA